MKARHIPQWLLLAMLGLPQVLQAETTQERIKRLAEGGRQQSWVLTTDCPAEQAAVRQFDFGGGSYGCADGTGNDTERSIAAALERPWVYRWGGKEDPSRLMTANELKQTAAEFLGYAEQQERQDRRVYSGAHCNATIARLTACAYGVAATRKDGGAPASTATAREPRPCPASAVAAVNQTLRSIDSQLSDFMRSNAGQQGGTSTPLLQAVMWGTSEQIKVIQQHCPQSDAFREGIENLTDTYQSAQSACRAVQSRPELCVGVDPRQLGRESRSGSTGEAAPQPGDASRSGAVSYDPVTGICSGGLACCQLPSYSDAHPECSTSGPGEVRTAR